THAHLETFGRRRDRSEHAPHERAVALRGHPRVVVVGDRHEFEAGGCRPSRVRDERARRVLLRRERAAERRHDFFAAAFPPLRPAALCCAVVPPCFELPPFPDCFPPCFDASGELAILAARAFDMPFFFRASYCLSFLTLARVDGTVHLRSVEGPRRGRAVGTRDAGSGNWRRGLRSLGAGARTSHLRPGIGEVLEPGPGPRSTR